MPTLRDIIIDNHDHLNDIFFDVELYKSDEIFKGFEFGSLINNVVFSPEMNKVIATHPDSYRFEKNADFILPIAREMENLFGLENLNYKVQSFDDRQFFVDIMVNTEIYEVTEGDEIVPMVSLTNSYDGKIKQTVALSFYRQICSNGMKAFSKKYSISARHLKGQEVYGYEKLFRDLREASTKISDFKTLSDRRLLPEELEEMVEYVKTATHLKFPKKGLPKVQEIAMNEANELDVPLNSWLAYNAFNNVLNHSESRIFPHEKEAIDKKILSFVESF